MLPGNKDVTSPQASPRKTPRLSAGGGSGPGSREENVFFPSPVRVQQPRVTLEKLPAPLLRRTSGTYSGSTPEKPAKNTPEKPAKNTPEKLAKNTPEKARGTPGRRGRKKLVSHWMPSRVASA